MTLEELIIYGFIFYGVYLFLQAIFPKKKYKAYCQFEITYNTKDEEYKIKGDMPFPDIMDENITNLKHVYGIRRKSSKEVYVGSPVKKYSKVYPKLDHTVRKSIYGDKWK